MNLTDLIRQVCGIWGFTNHFVEVVLRHFHRCCYRSSPLRVFLERAGDLRVFNSMLRNVDGGPPDPQRGSIPIRDLKGGEVRDRETRGGAGVHLYIEV
jgi:hypothetical protein